MRHLMLFVTGKTSENMGFNQIELKWNPPVQDLKDGDAETGSLLSLRLVNFMLRNADVRYQTLE